MAARLSLFGCPFDPEVGEERLAMKRAYAVLGSRGLPAGAPTDPSAVIKSQVLQIPGISDGGVVEVDGWALPIPAVDDPHELTANAGMALMRDGACRVAARRVREHVHACADSVPLMIGIDHCASGGAIEALSTRHGPDGFLLVVLDAHLDAVPGDIRQGLLAYACEHPALFGPLAFRQVAVGETPDYDCGSFLHDLIARDIVLPRRLVVLGCADLPAPALRKVDDVRVRRYLAHLDAMLARGMRVVSRDTLLAAADLPALVHSILGGYRGAASYLSVDLDVGAHAALTGVRFLDHSGLPAVRMLALFEAVLAEVTARGNRLTGLDLMEFDFYRAGAIADGRQDPTYNIALRLIEAAAERLGQVPGRTQWDGSLASA